MNETSQPGNSNDPELIAVVEFLMDCHQPTENKTRTRQEINSRGCPLSLKVRRAVLIAFLLMLAAMEVIAWAEGAIPLLIILTLSIGLLLGWLLYDIYVNR